MLTRSKSRKLSKEPWHLGPGRWYRNVHYRGYNSILVDVDEFHLVWYSNGRWWGYKMLEETQQVEMQQ